MIETKMHPIEIAQEVKNFPFFSDFGETLLLQICTMMVAVSFEPGEFILEQGNSNDCLYFLREGNVDVLLDGEKVANIEKKGEVIGEMSVIRSRPASTSLKSNVNTSCFMINSRNFGYVHPEHRDRLQGLLYRVYSLVLTERLEETNLKAKNFEVTARALEKAQKELESFSNEKIKFLLKEVEKGPHKSVLILEAQKKNQNIAKMAMGGTGVDLTFSENIAEAETALTQKQFDLVFIENKMGDLINKITVPFVAVAPLKFDHGNLSMMNSSNYYITRDSEERSFSIRTYLMTLTKILNQDFFGMEKYLSLGTEIKSERITKSTERDEKKEKVLSYFRSLGLRNSLLDRVQVAIEELLMNSIYDAPIDEKGKALFNHLPRTTSVELNESQESILRYAVDGIIASISVRDPFGALGKNTLITYLANCYSEAAGTLNQNEEINGGAGRGLHQIVESADLTVFNIQKNKKTEIICVWYIEKIYEKKNITTPTFHYFFT